MQAARASAQGFESVRGVPCDVELALEGTLPSWLAGVFVHTGPALFDFPRGSVRSWFDGLALLAGVELAGGGARYRCRFLESDAYRAALRRGRPALGEFGTAPERGPLGRMWARLAPPRATDNDNVNVAHMGDRVIAMTESTRQREFDPRTLATGAEVDYDDGLEGQLSTAHPWIDRDRDALVNLLVRFGRRSSYELHELPLGGRTRRRIASLPVERPSYVHSFAASERHLVVTEIPFRAHPLRMRFAARPFIERYRWHAHEETRVRVVRREDGALAADVRAPAMFLFHHVNAVEVDGRLDVDLVAHRDPSILRHLRLDALRAAQSLPPTGRLVRLSIPLGADGARVEPRPLGEERLELPRIAPRHEGRAYRWLWAVTSRAPDAFFDQILRVDAHGGAALRFARPGWLPNEPLFVPAPGAGGEDEGVVLCTVLDVGARASRFVVLDARDLALRAHARLPHVVPFHFHSQFFEAAALPAPAG